jgi:hypothetical protein
MMFLGLPMAGSSRKLSTMDIPRKRGSGAVGGLAVLAGGMLLAGCAAGASLAKPGAGSAAVTTSPGAGSPGPGLAERVCGEARQAAAKALGAPLSARVVRPAAADLVCVLAGRRVTVTIESQAGPRAYAEFDTETAHQSQVFGNGGAHEPDQDPVAVTIPGSTVAVWIPAQQMVVATDSTPDNGGAGVYVTVAVNGQAAPAATALSTARAAAAATFAAHPDGPA